MNRGRPFIPQIFPEHLPCAPEHQALEDWWGVQVLRGPEGTSRDADEHTGDAKAGRLRDRTLRGEAGLAGPVGAGLGPLKA